MKNSYLTMIVFTIFTISFCSKTQAQNRAAWKDYTNTSPGPKETSTIG